MAVTVQKTLRQLRNTRDLRAEMLALAAELAAGKLRGRLTVVDPVITAATVQEEWRRLLPALATDVRDRMSLSIEAEPTGKSSTYRVESGIALLDRPNYRYEVLRLLLGANLEDDGPQPIQGLMDKIGASQTPIRQALSELKQNGLAHSWGRGVEVAAENVSDELLAKIRALPQTLRFRFERGAQIKTPAALLQRLLPLLRPGAPAGWEALSLSGTPVAQADAPKLDLIGTPRLDLVAHIKRDAKAFDTAMLRPLDDGLELEPNILAPAPVVITLVRADKEFTRDAGLDRARCAYPMDVFLSLLGMGLREQALQYAQAVRA
jgi:hypothetical protein